MAYDDDIFSQTDEDIFQDDSSSSQKITDALASHIKSEHGLNIDSDILKDVVSDNVRAKIVIALMEAAGKWSDQANDQSRTKSVHYILDHLTDGLYSRVYEFYRLETLIFQRKVIFQVVKAMGEGSLEELKEVKEQLNLDITPTFLSTYIHTMGRILYNVLEQNRNTYKALSDELKLPLQMPALYEEVDDQGIPSARAFVIQQVVKAMKKNTKNVS
jgi:hypothetical protein